MRFNIIKFNNEELEALYQIIKDYEGNVTNNTEYYNKFYGDYDEEPLDEKIVFSILKKIGKVLRKDEKEEIDKNFLRKKYHTFNNSVDEKVWNVINKAFNQLITVEIKYFNIESAEFKKRKVDIYYKSSKYIIGHCHLRNDIRKFRVSRIGSAKLTNYKYKIPNNFDKNNY